jgi:hypothetical protein
MPVTRVTNNVLAANAALNNLNAGASITFTKPVVIPSLSGAAFGTGVTGALAVSVGSAGSFITNGGAAGTPSSITLANATGLPISTGVAGLGSGVATFLATPTSANLAAAVTDETGSEGLVFRNSPNLTGNPTINQNLIPQTCYKDGLIPVIQIFEDFPNGGTHPWVQGGNSGSGGHFNPSSNAPDSRAWGIQFLTTGAVATNTRSLFLGSSGNWLSSTPIGASIQSCFSFANASNIGYANGFQGGGTVLGVRLDSSVNQLILYATGIADVVLLSGLSLSSGNFSGGTRYRLFYRCISATQSEVYFASAPWNSSTWTTIYDAIITHSSIPFNWGASLPALTVQTFEAAAKTAYVDWASVIWDRQR